MSNKKWGSMFLLGALVGGVATLFMPKEKQEKSKKLIESKSKELQAGIIKSLDNEQVQKVLGKNKEEIEVLIKNVKSHVDKLIAKGKGAKAVKVDALLDSLYEEKILTKKQIKAIKEYLG